MKKTVITVVAMILICCISVFGTLAFLKKESSSVTNTFTAGKDLTEDDPATTDKTEGLHLYEYPVTQNDDGSYTLGDTPSADGTGIDSYKLLPGVTMPKKACVSVDGKTDTPAYLYIEVVDGLAGIDGLTYSIKSDWAETTLTGSHGGKIYVYSADSKAVIVTANVPEVSILTDDKIVVSDDFDVTSVTESKTLVFYSYLAQASAGADAESAFSACFLAAETSAAATSGAQTSEAN